MCMYVFMYVCVYVCVYLCVYGWVGVCGVYVRVYYCISMSYVNVWGVVRMMYLVVAVSAEHPNPMKVQEEVASVDDAAWRTDW